MKIDIGKLKNTKEYDATIAVTVEPHIKRAMQDIAKSKGVTLAKFMRHIIEQIVDEVVNRSKEKNGN